LRLWHKSKKAGREEEDDAAAARAYGRRVKLKRDFLP
jgi:hypothetical protein